MTPDLPTARAAATQAHKDPRLPAPPAFETEAEWLGALHHFTPAQALAWLAVGRTLCPHDRLHDRVYRRVVAVLDRACGAQAARAADVAGLLAALDAAFGLPFVDLSESYRVQALRAQQAGPAFRFVHRTVVRHLYDDLEVWQAFGYEGASYHQGGYVTRGFDDLAWLPGPADVSDAAGAAGTTGTMDSSEARR